MFGSNKAKQSRQPQERHKLTTHLSASLWQSEGQNGGVNYHWDMARLNPSDPEKSYSTKRPRELLEVPEFTAKLAEAFASQSGIESGLRKQLAALAAGLYQLGEVMESDSRNKEGNGPDGNSSLFTA